MDDATAILLPPIIAVVSSLAAGTLDALAQTIATCYTDDWPATIRPRAGGPPARDHPVWTRPTPPRWHTVHRLRAALALTGGFGRPLSALLHRRGVGGQVLHPAKAWVADEFGSQKLETPYRSIGQPTVQPAHRALSQRQCWHRHGLPRFRAAPQCVRTRSLTVAAASCWLSR